MTTVPKNVQKTMGTPVTEGNLVSLLSARAEDVYGIPMTLIDTLTTPNPIVDLFNVVNDNQPIKPYGLLIDSEGVDSLDISFAEGACPDDAVQPDEARFTLSAKSLGVCTPPRTYVALAANQSQHIGPRTVQTGSGPVTLANEWQYMMFYTLRAARLGLEWMIINGDPTNNPLNFEGLDRFIRADTGGRLDVNGVRHPEANSIVFDNAGNRITVNRMFQMIGAMVANYVNPTEIVILTSAGMINELARLISLNYADPGQKRQDILAAGTLPLYGYEIPFRTSQWIASTATGNDYEYMSTIYFLTQNYYNLPTMWLEFFDFSQLVANADLFAAGPNDPGGVGAGNWYMVPQDHGAYCTSTSFCLWMHGRAFFQAPQAFGRINNATYEFIVERTLT